MKYNIKIAAILLLIAFFGTAKGENVAKISVQCDNVIKANINKGAASANLCWLLDSDLKRPNSTRSMADAFKELGVKSLRFPYGHLADNYLWNGKTPNVHNTKLAPSIATMKAEPGDWSWATNADGSFNNAMDFDEYMQLCQSLNIIPLVVVNAISFKYEDGPSLDLLAESAKSWATYAKSHNFKVAYWQIGNEVDHHKKLISQQEYVNAYRRIATAIKSADPAANVGPGILSNVKYFNQIVHEMPELIDFTSCHQYMFAHKNSCATYEDWLNIDKTFIPNVINMQDAVSKCGKDMEILITETGVTGSGLKKSNAYAALWWYEVLMSELSMPNVAYSYFWGSHSPWKGQYDPDDDIGVLFRTDDNSSKPLAQVSALVNQSIYSNLVKVDCNNKNLSIYAFADNKSDHGTILVMNKSKNDIQTVINIKSVNTIESIFNNCLFAHLPYDLEFEKSEKKVKKNHDNSFNVNLKHYSITAIKY